MPNNTKKTEDLVRRTALTVESNGVTYVRGRSVLQLSGTRSFSEAIFLLLQGKLPTQSQRNLFDAILVASIDHGPLAPSADVARRVASTGNPLQAAVAAGVVALGDWHGGAIEQAGRLFAEAVTQSSVLLEQVNHVMTIGLQKYKRVPGYGHRLYTIDPRTSILFRSAKKVPTTFRYVRLALAVEKTLAKTKNKTIPLNIDGAMAAVLLGLGFPWHQLRGVFIIARTPGLVAHAWEQMQREKPVVRSAEKFLYDGPPIRARRKKS